MALSLSGGGVRAVGFHLGTMSMLDRLGLIRNFQIISSVSGGSMPGIGYSLAQHFDRPFQAFFDDFYDFLPDLNILEELLKRLTQDKAPSPSGRRDMITALANVYNEFYFEHYFGKYVKNKKLTFDALMNQPGKGHLKDMIFNATEFKTGTAFRFQVSKYRCLIGNGNIALCRKHASQIRIADIMAASSCIPVGMEPLFFPDDFHWPDDGKQRPTNDEIRAALAKNTNTHEPSFALMDGGVYDNQGITSTLLALNRHQEKITEQDTHECGFSSSSLGRGDPPGPEDWAKWMSGRISEDSNHKFVGVKPEDLDLLIVSDTPVRKASFFPRVLHSDTVKTIPENSKKKPVQKARSWIQSLKETALKRVTVGMLSKLTWLLTFALVLSAIFAFVEWFIFVDPTLVTSALLKWTLIIFHVGLPLLLIGVTLRGLFWYKGKKAELIAKLHHLIPHWERFPGKYINNLRLSDLVQMGILRIGPTAALTSSIYMDRIRGLGYSTAFSREDLQNKILANEIFALQDKRDLKDPFHALLGRENAWPPPPELLRIVDTAASMQTKLWIDQREGDPLNDLDYLVVCGQATICYNLMKYVWEELRYEDGSWIDPKMAGVFDQALTEWKKLMADPLSLLKDRKHQSRLPEMKSHASELEKLL
ncbi:MAG: patatin-like phospholipase family protein [Gammaproteobacteria bacterium]|nr:patatin-like phospholipase family protein [Gammaproteobacteria bacterium]